MLHGTGKGKCNAKKEFNIFQNSHISYFHCKKFTLGNRAFCLEYPINQQDNAAGKPGILIGRYPGDSYAGGNPWQLLTAAHAEVFYLGASAWLDEVTRLGNTNTGEQHQEWRDLLYLGMNRTL